MIEKPAHLIQLHDASFFEAVVKDLCENYPPLNEYTWCEDDLEEHKKISAIRQGYKLACNHLGINLEDILYERDRRK